MKEFFKDLYEYSHHYNQRLIQIFTSNPEAASERSHQLINHLVNAEHIWNSRIMNLTPKAGVWDMQPISDLAKVDNENLKISMLIVEEKDPETVVTYSNTKGEQYSNSIRDILFHVINHSTHHRAQIISDIKLHGADIIPMDYIIYKR